jgi:hypothetical protein
MSLRTTIAVTITSMILPACAGSTSLTTGALQPLAMVGHSSVISAAPIDVYQRIASQSSRCWFGSNGSLRQTHIFHADANPLADGGHVTIAIHKRTPDPSKPWGARAYQITLTGAQTTSVTFENVSFPLERENTIKSETLAWANGETKCLSAQAQMETATPPPPTRSPRKARPKNNDKPAVRNPA